MSWAKKWVNSTKTRTYYAWRSMRARCKTPSNASWDRYGGRGITVCQRWDLSYDDFVSDMGLAPEGKSIDRIDVNGNYEPSNCRWATMVEQQNNRSTNKLLTHNGMTKTQAEWAKEVGINQDTLHRRLHIYKMDVARALSPKSLQPTWKHGTRSGYENHKCKCDKCKAANTLRHRLRRQKLQQRIERCQDDT